jgi:hypothetical protein
MGFTNKSARWFIDTKNMTTPASSRDHFKVFMDMSSEDWRPGQVGSTFQNDV